LPLYEKQKGLKSSGGGRKQNFKRAINIYYKPFKTARLYYKCNTLGVPCGEKLFREALLKPIMEVKDMVLGRKLEKVFDFLGEVLAVLTVALIAFLYINGKFEFVEGTLLQTLFTIKEYAVLGTLIVVGIEFSVKRSFLFFVIFLVLATVAVVFSFFPGVLPSFLL